MVQRHKRRPKIEALRALAAGQDAQFASTQARALGLGSTAVGWLHECGETVLVGRAVWRFAAAGGAPDPAVTAMLRCGPHAVISHASAARYHRLYRVGEPDVPEVTVPHHVTRRPSGVVVRRSRSLPGKDIVTVGAVRYTSLARTVCDLADPDDEWETLGRLDDAVALGARPRWLHQRAGALKNGRPGIALLWRATAPGAAAEFRSWLERAAAHVYRMAALPDPEWNVPVRDADGLIGVVDALWRPWSVVSEKEGLRFHTTPRRRREDARRFNRLREAGYDPRRFSWDDVVQRPVEVAATVLRALQAAGADVDPVRLPNRIDLPKRPFC